MKITGIKVYQVDLPLHEGNYSWSEGKSVDVFDSTVVLVETDSGITGCGEVCPLGPVYLPAYAAGVRTGLTELAPQLIGDDPTQLLALNHKMDRLLKGHPYVKSDADGLTLPIDTVAIGKQVDSTPLHSEKDPVVAARCVDASRRHHAHPNRTRQDGGRHRQAARVNRSSSDHRLPLRERDLNGVNGSAQ